MPEGFDPQSFRSSFGHNTNIWAFRGANISAVEGLATLIPLEQDLSKTFFSEDGLGAARRICKDVRPETQVRAGGGGGGGWVGLLLGPADAGTRLCAAGDAPLPLHEARSLRRAGETGDPARGGREDAAVWLGGGDAGGPSGAGEQLEEMTIGSGLQ